MKKSEEKENISVTLGKLAKIVSWFENQQDIDVEKGIELVKEGSQLIKQSKERLKEIENEFKEIRKDLAE